MNAKHRLVEMLQQMDDCELELRYKSGSYTDESKPYFEEELRRRRDLAEVSAASSPAEDDNNQGRTESASAMLGIGLIVLGGIMMIVTGVMSKNTVRLAFDGRDATAIVRSYDPYMCGSTKRRHICHRHTVSADGRDFVIQLPEEHKLQTKVFISYLGADPDLFRIGHVGSNPLEYIAQNTLGRELPIFLFGICFVVVGAVVMIPSKEKGKA